MNSASTISTDQRKAVIENYIEVLSDLPEWAINQAVEQYRKGIFGDGKFVPLAGELAQKVRQVMQEREELNRYRRMQVHENDKVREQIAEIDAWKKQKAGVTDESRSRVQRMLDETRQNLINADAERDDKSEVNVHQETHDRFKAQARQDLVKVLERQMAEEKEERGY